MLSYIRYCPQLPLSSSYFQSTVKMKFALVTLALFSVALAVPNSQYVARDAQRGPVRPPGNTCSITNGCRVVSSWLIVLHRNLLRDWTFRREPRVSAPRIDHSIRSDSLFHKRVGKMCDYLIALERLVEHIDQAI
jgi:hypothetical protein